MNIYGIIPIRQGSKRFINKNFSDFRDTNLIMNTLSKLVNANIYEIFISTDVPEMVLNYINNSVPCKLFDKLNIHIVKRPDELAMDHSTTEDVVLDTIFKIDLIDPEPDYTIVLCQITSPTWSSHRLIHAINELYSLKIPVISITPAYQPSGCFYIFTKQMFINNEGIYTDKMRLMELPWYESIDIDYKYQLRIAESI